jgi:hypothetical protein
MNTQQLSSIGRQVIAIAAVVMGALTAALQGIKLPPAASTALVALGAVILGIEHYVSDPSTGTPPPPPPTFPPRP